MTSVTISSTLDGTASMVSEAEQRARAIMLDEHAFSHTLFLTGAEETKLQKRAVELNQGRAAQMGMLALMVHDKLGNVADFFPN